MFKFKSRNHPSRMAVRLLLRRYEGKKFDELWNNTEKIMEDILLKVLFSKDMKELKRYRKLYFNYLVLQKERLDKWKEFCKFFE